MSKDEIAPGETPEPFKALAELRSEHINLVQALRDVGADKQRIREFIQRAQATGKRFDAPSDRDAAQNIVTYWATHLYSAGEPGALSAGLPVLEPFDPSLARDLSKTACPFQGLSAYGEKDAERFFGRDEAVKSLLSSVAGRPITLVLGPKGSGKTSFVLAGFLPQFKAQLAEAGQSAAVLVALAGRDPFAALLVALREALDEPMRREVSDAWLSEQKATLERAPERLRALLDQFFAARPVVIVIDRLEDLFMLSVSNETQQAFARALAAACPDAKSKNRAILVVDEKYLSQTLKLAALQPYLADEKASCTPPPLSPAEVSRSIENAAASVGLKFDKGIVADLAQDVAGAVGALPALQFTLGKLWDRRRGDRITWEAYRDVGRPREALQQAAEKIFETLSRDEQEDARKLFLQLIQPTAKDSTAPEGAFIPYRLKRESRAQIESNGVARVLERFAEAGLIRRQPGANPDDDYFEVAHEVLAASWPRLQTWLREEREVSRKKVDLDATGRRYEESGDPGYLLSGGALEEAAAYVGYSSHVKKLVDDSREAERSARERESRIRTLVTIAAVTLTLIASSGWIAAYLEARAATKSAVASLDGLESMTKVISAQVESGEITGTAALDVLNAASDVLLAIGPRPSYSERRTSVLMKQSKVSFDILCRVSDRNQNLGYPEREIKNISQLREFAESELKAAPDSPEAKRKVYEAEFRMGDILATKKDDRPQALVEYTRALAMAQQLSGNIQSKSQNDTYTTFIKNKIAEIYYAIKELFGLHSESFVQDYPYISFIRNKIADIYFMSQKWPEAIDEYTKGLAYSESLLEQDINNSRYQKAVADAMKGLANLYKERSKSPEASPSDLTNALHYYKDVLNIRKRLASNSADDDPNKNIYLSNLRRAYTEIGDLYKQCCTTDGDSSKQCCNLNKALDYYTEALRIAQDQWDKDRENTNWQYALAQQHMNIGDVIAERDPEGALKQYSKALNIREKMANAHTANVRWAKDVAVTQESMAKIYIQTNQTDSVIKVLTQALARRNDLSDALPKDPNNQEMLIKNQEMLIKDYTLRGDAFKLQGEGKGGGVSRVSALDDYKGALGLIEKFERTDTGSSLESLRSELNKKVQALSSVKTRGASHP